MSKAILVLENMPKCCWECPIGHNEAHAYEIGTQCFWGWAIDKETETIPKWCPLKEVPEKKLFEDDWAGGYNACIDEILGGGE